jgi:prepilin-type N-terminal cleavage/methylation domain-containing protein
MKAFKSIHSRAFTLVEIMIVVAIIGLLCAIAIPNYIRARANSQVNACINNLRQLDAAMNQYALENRLASSATYSLTLLMPYIKLNSANSLPPCPAGGTYSPGSTVTNSPTCNIPGHALP